MNIRDRSRKLLREVKELARMQEPDGMIFETEEDLARAIDAGHIPEGCSVIWKWVWDAVGPETGPVAPFVRHYGVDWPPSP